MYRAVSGSLLPQAHGSIGNDAPVVDVLNQIVAKHGRWGFGLCFSWMRNNGYLWNHKRVWRVYKDMQLNLPRRTRRRLPKLPKQPLVAPTQKNITWALDFMHDTLYYGKPFRTLNVIDDLTAKFWPSRSTLACPLAG